MARAKRKSTVLDTARQRLAGIKAITPPVDFGPNLLMADYEQEINNFSAKIDSYNGMLATLDNLQNEIEGDENNLRIRNTRMLAAAEARYGADSSEYEQAGGTRQSERKRSAKKSTTKG
ncbi:MAG TPA: hypothetical protein VE842_03390 [Pyrinomonadaceae bacterium]|jgi:hypothetical protein|nr:hypothetical protein [Pyrinomonadaceae bacterium]